MDGLPGLMQGARSFLNAWEDYRIEAVEYRELEGERVLVLHNARGRGKTSGLELGQMGGKAANLFHIHGGKVTRLVAYFSCKRALDDLGLGPAAGAMPPTTPKAPR